MKWIKKEYVKFLEWGFKIAYLFLGLATFNVFLYDSPIQPFLVKVSLILGALTLIGRLMFFKDYRKSVGLPILIAFCVSFFISIVVNRQYGNAAIDLKWLVWTGVLFFLLYAYDEKRSKEEYKREFSVMAHIIMIYSAVAAVSGICMMVNLYHAKWWTASNELLQAGFHWGRLWGVYTDPNYGGVFSVAALLLCIYFFRKRKGWRKIPYAVMVVLDYFYITFSDSRTAEVAMVCSVGFWIIYEAVQGRKGRQKIILSILTAGIFAGIFIGGTSYVKSQYNVKIQQEIQKLDAQNASKNQAQKKQEMQNQQVGRKNEIQADVSNGRLELWKSGIEVWKTKPVFGTGYNSFIPYAEKNLPQTYAVNNSQGKYVSLHNEYLNILVYHGLTGAVVFAAFLILMIYKWCRGFWKISKEDRAYMGILTSCCIVVGIAMMFLLEGMHTNSPGSFILWTFLGYLMHESTQSRKVD